VPADWKALLVDVRAYVADIGYAPTRNFAAAAGDTTSYTLCGHTRRFLLPYSYEDPAIRWVSAHTEAACRDAAQGEDMYFAHTEAVGEIGVPLTQSMLDGQLHRFLYLVIHEDCHDQFDLPYGFEEALCNVIAYHGMREYAASRFGWWTRERRAARHYAAEQTRLTRAAVSLYRQTEALYARHARGEWSEESALQWRARLFASGERELGWRRGAMSNVGLANEMTYSRHFALIDQAHHALGGDVARTVAFFQRVDKAKPEREALLLELKISDGSSAQALRAYEDAVARTSLRLLADAQ
jgi:hypothetical protein